MDSRFFATSAKEGQHWTGQDFNVQWKTDMKDAKYIGWLSKTPSEHEVLTPPGTQYLTLSIETSPYRENKSQHQINMQQVI